MYTDFEKIEWAVIAIFPETNKVLCIDPDDTSRHIQMEYELLSELDLAYLAKLLTEGKYYIVSKGDQPSKF